MEQRPQQPGDPTPTMMAQLHDAIHWRVEKLHPGTGCFGSLGQQLPVDA
jgi:hypothetical protein